MLQKLLNAIRGLFGRKPSNQASAPSRGYNVSDRTSPEHRTTEQTAA